MIPARLGRSESFWAVAKVRSPHTGPGISYIIALPAARSRGQPRKLGTGAPGAAAKAIANAATASNDAQRKVTISAAARKTPSTQQTVISDLLTAKVSASAPISMATRGPEEEERDVDACGSAEEEEGEDGLLPDPAERRLGFGMNVSVHHGRTVVPKVGWPSSNRILPFYFLLQRAAFFSSTCFR